MLRHVSKTVASRGSALATRARGMCDMTEGVTVEMVCRVFSCKARRCQRTSQAMCRRAAHGLHSTGRSSTHPPVNPPTHVALSGEGRPHRAPDGPRVRQPAWPKCPGSAAPGSAGPRAAAVSHTARLRAHRLGPGEKPTAAQVSRRGCFGGIMPTSTHRRRFFWP